MVREFRHVRRERRGPDRREARHRARRDTRAVPLRVGRDGRASVRA